MNKNREDLLVHLNLKISNRLFSEIDTIRTQYLKDNNKLPSRSEIVRILLSEAIQSRISE